MTDVTPHPHTPTRAEVRKAHDPDVWRPSPERESETAGLQSGGDVRHVAAQYARAGLHVFPVNANTKEPLHRYLWKERAATTVAHVIEDVETACSEWGDDQVSIAWALGLDGYVALDLDVADPPDWWADLEAVTAVNITRRGRHLISPFPNDMVPGNGTGKFPTSGWGEVRGVGGYIVIAGPDRPGFDERQLDGLPPFPRPEWLATSGEISRAATSADVGRFIATHTVANRPERLTGVKSFLDGWAAGKRRPNGKLYKAARHGTAVDTACWIAKQAATGDYPAGDGFSVLRAWWGQVMNDDLRRRDGRELDSIIAWGIGQVDLEQTAPLNVDRSTDEVIDANRLPDGTATGDEVDKPLFDPSFLPLDLAPVLAGDVIRPEPTIMRRDDRQALFYPGQVNGVHGDSGTGKGWITLFAIEQQIRAGRNVMLVDTEDVAESIVSRLRLLGATDIAIIEHLIYIRPTAPFEPVPVEHLVDTVIERDVSLAVIDSLGECFGLDGVDENHDAEVGPWLRKVARRLADAGPAVLLVDHSTKANDNPLHPSGSKRKRAAIGGASYVVTANVPLAAGKGGRLRLVCAKDRHGTYARGEHVADLVMMTDLTGTRVALYAPDPADVDGSMPVVLAARAAVKAVKAGGAPMSLRTLRAAMSIKASNTKKDAGIDLAIARGALEESIGLRNARLFTYVQELPDKEES